MRLTLIAPDAAPFGAVTAVLFGRDRIEARLEVERRRLRCGAWSCHVLQPQVCSESWLYGLAFELLPTAQLP